MNKIATMLISISLTINTIGCSNAQNIDSQSIRKLTYIVMASSQNNEWNLGEYDLEYFPDDKRIIETKDYCVTINGNDVTVINSKAYSYDDFYRLISYYEEEKYNQQTMFQKEYKVDYGNEFDSITLTAVENNEPAEVYVLQNTNIPYTVNSSFIALLPLLSEFSYDKEWTCYQGIGLLDYYTYQGTERVENDVLGSVICNKITQVGMFQTTYWINDDGIIVQIEQKMDKNYTAKFSLSTVES